MCHAKPGLRCTSHTRNQMLKTYAAHLSAPQSQDPERIREAVERWETSPEGLDALNPATPAKTFTVPYEVATEEGALERKERVLTFAPDADRYKRAWEKREEALRLFREIQEQEPGAAQPRKRGRPKSANPKLSTATLLAPAEREELLQTAGELSEREGAKVSPSEVARRRITAYANDPRRFYDVEAINDAESFLLRHAESTPDERGKALYEAGFARFERKEGGVGRRPTEFASEKDSYKREDHRLNFRVEQHSLSTLRETAETLAVSTSDLLSRVVSNRPLFQLGQHMSINSMLNHCAGARRMAGEWDSLTTEAKTSYWLKHARAKQGLSARSELDEHIKDAHAQGVVPEVLIGVKGGHVERPAPLLSASTSIAELRVRYEDQGYREAGGEVREGEDLYRVDTDAAGREIFYVFTS